MRKKRREGGNERGEIEEQGDNEPAADLQRTHTFACSPDAVCQCDGDTDVRVCHTLMRVTHL